MELIKPLIHPACFIDESPLGYLHRLAKLNHYKTIDWLIKDAQHDVSPIEICDLLAKHEWTGFNYSHPFNDINSLSYLYFQPTNIFLCHLCFKENNYWDYRAHLVLSQVCVKHRCWKSDSCPSCLKKLGWRTGNLDYCECGARRLKSTTFLPQQVVEFASFMEGEAVQVGRNLVAKQFTYKSRCDLFMLFSRNLSRRGRLPRLTTIDTTQTYWVEIANIFLGENEVFHDFLYQLYDQRAEDFRDFYRKFQSYPQACLKIYSDILVKFIAHDLKTPITKRHRSLIRDKPQEGIWLALQTAARQFIVPKSVLLQLIKNEKIQHQSQIRKSRTLILIYMESSEHFQTLIDNYINFENAAKLLGATRPQLRVIIEHGLLKDICKPDDGYSQWLISSEEITRLRLTLLSRVKDSEDETITISDALAFYSKGFDELLVEILEAIFNDQITVVGPKDCKHLRDICLDKDEFLCWRKQRLTMRDTMSVVDLAKRFGINQEAMYQIVNVGLIKSVSCGKNGMNRQISEEDINEFKEKYALLSKMAWAFANSSPKKLKMDIDWYGVEPIDKALGIELRQTIYLRSDLYEGCIFLGYMLDQKGDWSFDKGKPIADLSNKKTVESVEIEMADT